MKKTLLLLALLALLLTSAVKPPVKLVRLTLINKSGMDIEVSLTGKTCDQFYYYLKVPEGDRLLPTEKTFTVIPDSYSVDTYFVELWDPVYGHKCTDRTATVDITHNVRVIILECDITPPNGGDTENVKLGGNNRGSSCGGGAPKVGPDGVTRNCLLGGP